MPTSSLGELVLHGLKSNLDKVIQASFVGICLEAFIFGSILTHTLTYFRLYGKTDPFAHQFAVGFGTASCFAQLLWTTYQGVMVYSFQTDFINWFHTDCMFNMTTCLWMIFANNIAAAYFTHRAWVLAKRHYAVLIPAGICMTINTVLGMITVTLGWQMPKLHADGSNIAELTKWFANVTSYSKPWEFISSGAHFCLCVMTVVIFIRSRDDFKQANRGDLLRKIVVLTVQTILIPVLIVVGLIAVDLTQGTTWMAWDRTFAYILGPAYFYSVIYSLVQRSVLAETISGNHIDFNSIQISQGHTRASATVFSPRQPQDQEKMPEQDVPDLAFFDVELASDGGRNSHENKVGVLVDYLQQKEAGVEEYGTRAGGDQRNMVVLVKTDTEVSLV